MIYDYLEREDRIKEAVIDLKADADGKAYAGHLIRIMNHLESDYLVVKNLVSMLNLAV